MADLKEKIILIVDKNSTWLKKRPLAIAAAKLRGWQIVAVGDASSGLHRETPDEIIYATAAEKNWAIITRDRDFIDIARTVMAKTERMTDVFLTWDVINDADQLYKAIAKVYADGHLGEAANARVTNIEFYLEPIYKSYCEAKRTIIRAEATGRQPTASAIFTVSEYNSRLSGKK